MAETFVPALPRQKNQDESVFERETLNDADFKRIIRDLGLKVTTQRLAILKVLHAGKQHVTAQEVYEGIQDDFPEIGFATVYRFLKKLAEHQVVTELRMGGLPARYELAPQKHHDHLTCLRCGKIYEFENHDIEKIQEAVASKLGFKLKNHVLELYGDPIDSTCCGRRVK